MKRKFLSIIAVAALVLGLSSFIVSTPENPTGTQQTSVSETVNWLTLEEALALQKKNPKPIMMDVYTTWCGPCKMLDKNTFQDPRVAKYLNENYYSVKFNAEGPDTVVYQGVTYKNPNYQPNQPGRNGVHEFTIALGVNSYPTIFFLDKTGQPLMPLVGYRTPAQIELYLHLFATEKYRDITTQEQFTEYENNFKVTWN
ncbi:MAG TPA: thioredoxin fold domain-containing protein [Flavobacteriales bacterium]